MSAGPIRSAIAAALLWLAAMAPAPASAQTHHEWKLKVGSWNVLNFGTDKATFPTGADRTALLTEMARIAAAYDIVIFQEVLQAGTSVTAHLANYLPGYQCNWMSAASGRVGRQERYAVCAKPATLWGTIAIAPLTDYSTLPQNFTAPDNSLQAAQQVWMRPPVMARVTFTPTDPLFSPFVFDLYTNHTKPAYGTRLPRGAVPLAPNTSSVHYELQAIERNLRAAPLPGRQMVIGDLNSDCASYPVLYRGTDFTAWTWHVNYGQRTNTAPGAACGYDQILLNTAILPFRTGFGVEYPGYDHTTRLDAKRVSDHYPVWVEFGEQRTVPARKRALIPAGSLPVSEAKKQRKYATTNTVNIAGQGLPVSQPNGQLYVIANNAAFSFKSNLVYTLTDVRGGPTPSPTDADGNFAAISWPSPPAGGYIFVFDANGDGKYDRADGDFANSDTEADIYVTAASTSHSDLVTLGDNMVARDVFSLSQAKNVYLVGKNLPPSATRNAYILSWKRLKAAGYNDWAAARADQVDLATYAIPIQRAGTGVIQTSTLTPADMRQAVSTNPSGELFMSVWSKPAQLMNATVNYQPPPASVFSPSQGGTGDPPDSPDDTGYEEDVCATVYKWGTDPNLRRACNFGFGFSGYYGADFAVAIDLDNDGKLDVNDPVDARDIGDMKTYFDSPGNTVLGPNANGNPAVSEYKEYLSRALSVDLGTDNIFDEATQKASGRYACGAALSKPAFQMWIVPDSQTGFRMLDPTAYSSTRQQTTGIQQYEDAYIDEEDYVDADVCVSAEQITYSGPINATQGSRVVNVAPTQVLDKASLHANDSLYCFAAFQSAAAGSIAVGLASSVVTAGTGAVAGIVGAGAIEVAGALGCLTGIF